ncbi:chemotaxis protein CheW [Herbaspirillum sp. NPDC087042]|uniref:chemotaxis protein CheW n=1 Tax=Herbaspirillum sp. NPDC087042 TaxID=3364004 RepID=UPI0038130765
MANASAAWQSAAIDDCWNRIGTKGDSSCPLLQQHVRCLNCPTFASAAMQQLDRVPASAEVAQAWGQADVTGLGEGSAQVRQAQASALVVRIGEEWLAIATVVVQEVTEARALHSLPHQRNPAIQGVLNIRGALRICVSLAQLFQLTTAPAKPAAQLLVVHHEGQTLVFPVDEVAGLHRYGGDTLAPVPTTLAHAAIQYTRGMLDWRGRQIGLLDHDLLFYVLNRSMT